MSHRPLALEISCGRIIGGEPIGYKSRSAQFQRADWYIAFWTDWYIPFWADWYIPFWADWYISFWTDWYISFWAEWYIHPCRGIVRTSSQSLMGRPGSMRGPHPTGNAVFRFQLAVEVSFARSITDVNLKRRARRCTRLRIPMDLGGLPTATHRENRDWKGPWRCRKRRFSRRRIESSASSGRRRWRQRRRVVRSGHRDAPARRRTGASSRADRRPAPEFAGRRGGPGASRSGLRRWICRCRCPPTNRGAASPRRWPRR